LLWRLKIQRIIDGQGKLVRNQRKKADFFL
jgi:hypothetical protein